MSQRQSLARSDAKLPLYQIDTGDHLRDGMLDLKAGVHLHKIKTVRPKTVAAIGDELDRAGADITDRLCGTHRSLAHGRTHLVTHPGAGASSITF